MFCSPPGSSVHGVFQARILAWLAISFFRVSSWPRDWTWVSLITGRFFTVWATREAPKMPSLVIFYYCNIPAIDQQNSHYFIAQEIIFSILWYLVSYNIPMENNLKKNKYVCIYMHAKSLQTCPTLCDPMDSSPIMLLCPEDSPGKNTGVGFCVLLQGIFLTQRPNSLFLRLLHCRQILYSWTTAAAAKSLQSCLTLCDPTDGSPPCSPVPGILQARNCSGLSFPSPLGKPICVYMYSFAYLKHNIVNQLCFNLLKKFF